MFSVHVGLEEVCEELSVQSILHVRRPSGSPENNSLDITPLVDWKFDSLTESINKLQSNSESIESVALNWKFISLEDEEVSFAGEIRVIAGGNRSINNVLFAGMTEVLLKSKH